MQLCIVIRVFIASPGDVRAEREEACKVIAEWNGVHSLKKYIVVEAVTVETHSILSRGKHPQDIINDDLIEPCDLLVGIFWTKLGTPTEKAASGTIQEIEEFQAKKGGDRVMIYFSNRPLPHDTNLKELRKLEKFRAVMSKKGLHRTFVDTADFARSFRNQLEAKILQLEQLREYRDLDEQLYEGRNSARPPDET